MVFQLSCTQTPVGSELRLTYGDELYGSGGWILLPQVRVGYAANVVPPMLFSHVPHHQFILGPNEVFAVKRQWFTILDKKREIGALETSGTPLGNQNWNSSFSPWQVSI